MQDSPEVQRPTDCGLAIALPLCYWSFRADYLRPQGRRGFPRDYGEQARGPGASAWEVWRAFAPVASEIRAVCRRAARLGVRVRSDATLDDVRTLFATCRVVTLFSHARFPGFKPADLLDPAGIARQLDWWLRQVPRSPTDAFLREAAWEWQAYASRNNLNPPQLGETGLRDALCACFNALIDRDRQAVFFHPSRDKMFPAGRTIPEQPPPEATENGLLVRFSRLDFEVAFPTEILARPLIDFADGAQTVHALRGLIPVTFGGVADLSICHSAPLGEFLKGKDTDRRPCIVIMNRPASHIPARVRIYRHTIELLGAADARLDYVTAADKIRQEIISY